MDGIESVPMKIRNYHAKDAALLAELYRRSVMILGLRDYSSQQVKAWASIGPDPERIHRLIADGRTRIVAVDDSDRPVGFGDLERDGHIDLLYCSPHMAGKGVASTIYDELERIARERGANRLYAEASEGARRFFVKKGFTVIEMRQFQISGVDIHHYAIEKTWANRPAGSAQPSHDAPTA